MGGGSFCNHPLWGRPSSRFSGSFQSMFEEAKAFYWWALCAGGSFDAEGEHCRLQTSSQGQWERIAVFQGPGSVHSMPILPVVLHAEHYYAVVKTAVKSSFSFGVGNSRWYLGCPKLGGHWLSYLWLDSCRRFFPQIVSWLEHRFCGEASSQLQIWEKCWFYHQVASNMQIGEGGQS